MLFQCPGAMRYTRPTPEFYTCRECGDEIEIWSDEIETKCTQCGTVFTRPREQGCIDHCEMARECLGEARYQRLVAAVKNKGDQSE